MKKTSIISHLALMKSASRELISVPTSKKNKILTFAAQLLINNQSNILKANQIDIKKVINSTATSKEVTPAFVDRLTLNPQRILAMSESLQYVSSLPDPLDEILEKKILNNGLQINKIRSPFGVILLIFESRPNVAVEAFSLALKSSNSIILKGGRESVNTTHVLCQILKTACLKVGLSQESLWNITDPDRKVTHFLLNQKRWIDLVIPRGGESLIHYVESNSKIPIIKNDRGLCHIYVHEDADLEMAEKIIVNAKTQRPSVCNAVETILIHKKIAQNILPALYGQMLPFKVKWFVCSAAYSILKGKLWVQKAKKKSWNTEYLDLLVNCKVVSSLDQAIAHIDEYSSHHSEAIITRSKRVAEKFQQRVDAAAVYWNASTRFTDGFEFGLGGEIGISTQKLHARGPVGLKELTCSKWIIQGNGQVRESK